MQQPRQWRPPSAPTPQVQRRRWDSERRKREPWRAWYKLAAWLHARAACLYDQPLCVRCLAAGTVTAATVVNHIRPHRGDWALFTDRANHESLCAHCHDSIVQREEAAGVGGA